MKQQWVRFGSVKLPQYRVLVAQEQAALCGAPRDPLGEEMLPASMPKKSLTKRCQELLSTNPDCTVDDVKALICAWDLEVLEPQLNGRARDLLTKVKTVGGEP